MFNFNSPVVQTIFKMFAAKEFGEQVVNIVSGFLGGRVKSSARADTPATQEAPKDVDANKGMKDEARELHALLEAMSGHNTGINYTPKPSEFWIPVAIAARLKPGAVKKLFDSFATEVVSVKHSEIAGYTQHEPDPGGKPRKETPIKEDFTSEINHLGPQIIRGLVWLAVKSQTSPDIPAPPAGTDQKLKGVCYVVSLLETSRLLENTDDKLAAAGDKGKALAAIAAKNTDTLAHVAMAYRKLGYDWGILQEILRSPTVRAARDAIDDATEVQQILDAHETLQETLRQAVIRRNTHPGWLARRIEARQRERVHNYWLIGLSVASFIGLIVCVRWLFAA